MDNNHCYVAMLHTIGTTIGIYWHRDWQLINSMIAKTDLQPVKTLSSVKKIVICECYYSGSYICTCSKTRIL